MITSTALQISEKLEEQEDSSSELAAALPMIKADSEDGGNDSDDALKQSSQALDNHEREQEDHTR